MAKKLFSQWLFVSFLSCIGLTISPSTFAAIGDNEQSDWRECLMYAPVCGEDENTYLNACAAALAGVEVAYDGECENDEDECATDDDCDGGTCIEGYCEYDGAEECSTDDECEGGTCVEGYCEYLEEPACSSSDDCDGGTCVDGVCEYQSEACNVDDDCSPGICINGQCIYNYED